MRKGQERGGGVSEVGDLKMGEKGTKQRGGESEKEWKMGKKGRRKREGERGGEGVEYG